MRSRPDPNATLPTGEGARRPPSLRAEGPVFLVLQGLGPFVGAQKRLVERFEATGIVADEVHATSSGSFVALYLAALHAGASDPWDAALERLVRSIFFAPWRLEAFRARAEALIDIIETKVEEPRLDEAVRALNVFVYSHDNAGRRVVERPTTWRALRAAALHACSIPLLIAGSKTHLDGIAVFSEDLAARSSDAIVWSSAFPSLGATFLYAFGLTPASDFVAPLRLLSSKVARLGLWHESLSCLELFRRPLLLLLRALRIAEQGGAAPPFVILLFLLLGRRLIRKGRRG